MDELDARLHRNGQHHFRAKFRLRESDHGRLKSRLRPMRGLTRLRSARVISAGHAFIQNLRRGHYELGVDLARHHRLPEAFAELALAI